MADNTKQLSKITIIDNDGKTTSAHFAADINNFMVYDNNGAENSVKDSVFGATDPGTFKSIKDTAGNITKDNSMWSQLATKAQECYDILDKNKSFWDGLSKAEYTQPSDPDSPARVDGEYLASGDQINALHFYGEDAGDSMEGQRQKLISLGALEDFAKRIPTMGGSHDIGQDHVAFGAEAEAASGSFAVYGEASGASSVAIGPNTKSKATNQIAIGNATSCGSLDGQVVIGSNIKGDDTSSLIIGPLKIQNGILYLPKKESKWNSVTKKFDGQIPFVAEEFFSARLVLEVWDSRFTSSSGYFIPFTLVRGQEAAGTARSPVAERTYDDLTTYYAEIEYEYYGDSLLDVKNAKIYYKTQVNDDFESLDKRGSVYLSSLQESSIAFY